MRPRASIENALTVIAARTVSADAVWLVGGSAGLMLRGIALPALPRDLDLYADTEDAVQLHKRLASYAIDQPAFSTTAIYESRLSHYRIEDTAVELVGGFVVQAHKCRYTTQVREQLLPLAECASHAPQEQHTAIKLVPLAHELLFNWLRGREDRVAVVAEAMAADPARHYPALEKLIASNAFNQDAVKRIEASLRSAEGGSRDG